MARSVLAEGTEVTVILPVPDRAMLALALMVRLVPIVAVVKVAAAGVVAPIIPLKPARFMRATREPLMPKTIDVPAPVVATHSSLATAAQLVPIPMFWVPLVEMVLPVTVNPPPADMETAPVERLMDRGTKSGEPASSLARNERLDPALDPVSVPVRYIFQRLVRPAVRRSKPWLSGAEVTATRPVE